MVSSSLLRIPYRGGFSFPPAARDSKVLAVEPPSLPSAPGRRSLPSGRAEPPEQLPAGSGLGGPPRRSRAGPPGPRRALRLEASSCRPPTPLTGSVAGWEATRDSKEMKLGARTTGADPVIFPSQEKAALPNVPNAPTDQYAYGRETQGPEEL